MPSQSTLQFGNFICRFGESKVLLHFANEIIIPAFLDQDLQRQYRDHTRFFFDAVRLIRLERTSPPVVGIAGRIVKDTLLHRTQIYIDGKGLVHDEEDLESAPSSLFLLILNNHKIVYTQETPFAPDMRSFGATAGHFVREKWKDLIDSEYEAGRQGAGIRTSKRRLMEICPKPRITTVELSTKDSITEFIRRFKRLTSVSIRLIETNDESDRRETYRALRDRKKQLRSERTRLIHESKDGLDKDASAEEITDAAATGNSSVDLKGKDEEGNELKGNNDNFKLQIHTDAFPEEIKEQALFMYNKFRELIEQETIKTDDLEASAETNSSLWRIAEEHEIED